MKSSLLWNGMIENCHGMEWEWNSNFQEFGSILFSRLYIIFDICLGINTFRLISLGCSAFFPPLCYVQNLIIRN